MKKAYQQEMEELQRLKKVDDQLKETFLEFVKSFQVIAHFNGIEGVVYTFERI